MKKTIIFTFLILFIITLLPFCTKSVEQPFKPEVCDIIKEDNNVSKQSQVYRKAPVQALTSYDFVVYLEFYGDTTISAYWNGGRTIISDSAFLTESQIDIIISQVQFDYSPWSLLVTKDKNIYNATPEANRQKIIISDTHSWYGSNAGGVAYLQTLFWTFEVEGFVFSKLLNYDTKRVWETITHEVGHTIGLKHQVICSGNVIVNQYNNTIVNGNAPIMGSVPQSANGTWWVGPTYEGCKKIQKDSVFIKSALR
jgi:serralysin